MISFLFFLIEMIIVFQKYYFFRSDVKSGCTGIFYKTYTYRVYSWSLTICQILQGTGSFCNILRRRHFGIVAGARQAGRTGEHAARPEGEHWLGEPLAHRLQGLRQPVQVQQHLLPSRLFMKQSLLSFAEQQIRLLVFYFVSEIIEIFVYNSKICRNSSNFLWPSDYTFIYSTSKKHASVNLMPCSTLRSWWRMIIISEIFSPSFSSVQR